jgi:hypothetical protein
MAFLLTWHGTLLCRRRQGGVLVHCPLANISDDVEPVVLDLPIEQLRADFGHHVRATMPELPSHPPGSLQRFRLQRSADQQTITLGYETAFLSAELEGDRVTLVRTEARDWESFLPVSEVDLDALRQILASSWLIRSSGALIERPTTWRFFNLQLGELMIDLRHQMPFDLASWPHRLTLLRDGWRIEQICQYRPLVYYSVFDRPEIMEQFAISVRSLIQFGRYQGQIVVLTDRASPELARMLPAECKDRVTIIPLQPHDRPGFMVARYLILDWPDAWRYQPLLYVDADIVFDRDVTPMLHAIAMSDRIAAPVELMSPLARNPSVGATLLQRDLCSPGYMAGFNSGTLGIPNVRAHAETLRLIRRIIANHSLLHGREALPYADQEIANYVSFRLAHFDTGLISRFVRYGGEDAHLGERCGLVHFWPVPGIAARTQAMRDYLTRLGTPQ